MVIPNLESIYGRKVYLVDQHTLLCRPMKRNVFQYQNHLYICYRRNDIESYLLILPHKVSEDLHMCRTKEYLQF